MELIVVTVIFLVISGALLVSFLVGRTSFLSADAYVQVQQEARRALDNMVRELREARNAPAPTVTDTADDGDQLDFQIALGFDLDLYPDPLVPDCPDNAICWGAQDATGANQFNWSVRYRITNVNATTGSGQLVREVYNAPPVAGGAPVATRVLANGVLTRVPAGGESPQALDFSVAGGIVTVRFRIQEISGQLPGGSMAISSTGSPLLETRVRLRNP